MITYFKELLNRLKKIKLHSYNSIARNMKMEGYTDFEIDMTLKQLTEKTND